MPEQTPYHVDVVTESIRYANLVHPVRRGLRWLAVYFAITLPSAALIFRSNFDDFVLVCIPIVFPGSILPFVSPWSRARELAKQQKTVRVTPDTVSIDGIDHKLPQCRWFRGFAFHDPKLAEYPAYNPAVIITWPPYADDNRTMCGLSAESEAQIIVLLQRENIPQDQSRRINERFLLNAASVGAACVTVGAMASVNLVVVPGIPLPSEIISAVVSGIAARIWLKHQFGHIQFQDPTRHTLMAWATLIIIGTIRFNRRNRGAPLLQNTALLIWIIPLAIAQGACLLALYRFVRKREDLLVGDQLQCADRR